MEVLLTLKNVTLEEATSVLDCKLIGYDEVDYYDNLAGVQMIVYANEETGDSIVVVASDCCDDLYNVTLLKL